MRDTPVVLLAITDAATYTRASALLEEAGFRIVNTRLRPETLPQLSHVADLAVIGLESKDGPDTLESIRAARQSGAPLPVLAIAHESSESLAIAALRAGVSDYLRVPFSADAFDAAVRHCLGRRAPAAAVELDETGMVGNSPEMQGLRSQIGRLAANDTNVLITGETGTGKELTAQSLHRNGRRRRQPLVCVNCAAIPDNLLESELFGYEKGAFTGAERTQEGKLQLADGGTVFLDEIGEMSPFAQAKILRAIETKEVYPLGCRRPVRLDFRIIAATNRSLASLAGGNGFRKDLFFRLNVAHITLPPLRERASDIPLLVAHFVGEFNARFGRDAIGFGEGAMKALMSYHWPGNVRELRNVVEAAFVNQPSRHNALLELPPHLRDACAGDAPAEERERLMQTLLATNWNISKAAEQLHWSRMTVYRKLAKYRLARAGVTSAGAV